MRHLNFTIEPVPPFRLDLTAWAIRRRPENRIDLWDGETYRRVLTISENPVLVSVVQCGEVTSPVLEITASCERIRRSTQSDVIQALERLLGTRVDLSSFYRLAEQNPKLSKLARRFAGLKPPRFPTGFEALVNGIACQQLSLAVGIILLGRLAGRFGLVFRGQHDQQQHAFPRPEDLARATIRDLMPLGFSTNKSRALIDLSTAIADGNLDLEGMEHWDNYAIINRLLNLRGVGRWTAEYALLRGFGRMDLFPGDDVGARNNLARWLNLKEPPDYARVKRVLAKWKPFSGLIYFHLLLDHLNETGHLATISSEGLPAA